MRYFISHHASLKNWSEGLVKLEPKKQFMRYCLILSLLFFVSGNQLRAQEKDQFVLVKKEGRVSIFERWIFFPKSDPPVKAREVKGQFYFKNSLKEAVRLLKDEKRIQKWQSHVSEFKVYPTADSSTWVEYSYHDIPWPVSDQDHLLVYKIIPGKSDEIFITFESKVDNHIAPLRKGVTRMTLAGSWTFQRVNKEEVMATYRILSTPLKIPKFLTDPIIRNNMMTTIQAFVALMEP